MVQRGRWLRLRLETVWRRPWLVSVRLWQLVFRPIVWLGFLGFGSVGLAPVSLWRLDFFASLRRGLGAIGVRRRSGLLSARDRRVGTFRPDGRDCSASSGRQEREAPAKAGLVHLSRSGPDGRENLQSGRPRKVVRAHECAKRNSPLE